MPESIDDGLFFRDHETEQIARSHYAESISGFRSSHKVLDCARARLAPMAHVER